MSPDVSSTKMQSSLTVLATGLNDLFVGCDAPLPVLNSPHFSKSPAFYY